jgi:hypothetical protein
VVHKDISKGLGTFCIGVFLLASSSVTMASEPGNNNFTPNSSQLTGDWESLIATNSGFIYGLTTGTMNSSTDVDYVVVTCASPSKPHIQDIKLGDTVSGSGALPGDYDLYIYYPTSSTAVASGTLGGTSPENVDVSALGRSTLIAKVIYFAGTLGNYGLRVDCG